MIQIEIGVKTKIWKISELHFENSDENKHQSTPKSHCRYWNTMKGISFNNTGTGR